MPLAGFTYKDTMTTHRTTPEHAAVAGWVGLDADNEVTVVPVVDRRYGVEGGGSVYARPTYADSLIICERYGAQMIEPSDVERIREIGVPLVCYLGTPTAETSLHHSKLHDADMHRQLTKLDWQGDQVVMNLLKWWMHSAPAGRSRLKGWWDWNRKKYWQPDMVAHNREHFDDGTGLMMKRPRRTALAGDGEVVAISEIPPPSSGGDTLPSIEVPWLDPELLHRERVVLWLEAQIAAGVKEIPNGSNNSPVIGPWLRKCVRDGKGPAFGRYLEKAGANWCAATRCEAIDATRIDGDLDAGHLYRCSGIELEKDTKANGWFRPVELALTGEWKPELGDGVLLPRGKPGGWQRHVATFIGWAGDGRIQTIDGNKGNRIQTWEYGLHELLGFFEMPSRTPRHNYRGVSPELPDEIDDLNDGENAIS